ncbi:MAG: chemotaxis protein CheW [Caldilinea sp.]|nr:chemotaxis protein CheW [Caldilinea sp.]MCB0059669.1 chemotaxis protein CheW [Caldilineaceae bacterium]MCB0148711.1 chemotaxis protein CheW [Caldilineaceae bacterium]MCB9114381.1 chemotaxis protein CheW [Caldilineaceae bacterium]MCB9119560.1 chemotaxis protein CheW [Caldilineaceae bacterium]
MQAILFCLDEDEYGFDILSVLEVVRMVALTPLPDRPEWLSGVVNLRGHVIPVIDLRRRLHLPPHMPDLNTPIIIAQSADRPFGVVVDRLDTVIELGGDVVEQLAMPGREQGALVAGLAHLGHRVVKLLNVDALAAAIPVIG